MISNELVLRFREVLKPFQPGRADLLHALHALQEEFGYVPREAVPVVAEQLGMTPAQVYGPLTFYSEFRTTPLPDTLIGWCSGPACRLKGGDRVRQVLEKLLGIGMGENTPDNRLGLHLGQCNGTCQVAPIVWINGRVHGSLTVSDAVKLARELKGDE